MEALPLSGISAVPLKVAGIVEARGQNYQQLNSVRVVAQVGIVGPFCVSEHLHHSGTDSASVRQDSCEVPGGTSNYLTTALSMPAPVSFWPALL